jgi:plastocyanin
VQDNYLISSYAHLLKENLYKMRFSLAAVTGILAAVPAFVHAQGQPQSQMVMVGQDGQLSFSPPSMTAAVGSNITFMFMSKNHSVVQSSFADPCNPLPNGFAAQYFPIAAGTTTFPTVTISVTSPNAIWFYCPQTNPVPHCKMGMVGAINPPPDKTFETFQAIAKGEQPPPAASGGSSSVPGATPPGATPPGATPPGATPPGSVPTGAPIPGSAPPASGGPIIGGSSSSSGALPNSSGTPTSSTQPTGAALPQMKGAFTAIIIGVLGVVVSLL